MEQKETPNSPMNGGQGVEVSKTLFYKQKAAIIGNYYFKLYSKTMFHVKHVIKRSLNNFCVEQINIYVSRETFRLQRNEEKMGRIIAIANQKGGVGKTTTAINLSACLAEAGQHVLVIDIDPQGNTTSGLGISKDEVENTVYQVMLQEIDITEAICENVFDNLDVIPSNVNLAGAEIDLIDVDDREYILKNAINEVKENYDYIILDCPPSLSMLTVNAMTASNTVLVPIQCEYYALEGLTQLIHTINLVKRKLNPELELEGVVFTMYDSRTNLSLQVVENVKENLKQNIYKTIIPRNIRLAEAPSHGLPITIYDSKSSGAESYRLLAEEVMSREENGGK